MAEGFFIENMRGRKVLRGNAERFVDGDFIIGRSSRSSAHRYFADLGNDMLLRNRFVFDRR